MGFRAFFGRRCFGCFGTCFTHAQTCDNVRVQGATQWTASVHTLHMRKPVLTFVFKVSIPCPMQDAMSILLYRLLQQHAQSSQKIKAGLAKEKNVMPTTNLEIEPLEKETASQPKKAAVVVIYIFFGAKVPASSISSI